MLPRSSIVYNIVAVRLICTARTHHRTTTFAFRCRRISGRISAQPNPTPPIPIARPEMLQPTNTSIHLRPPALFLSFEKHFANRFPHSTSRCEPPHCHTHAHRPMHVSPPCCTTPRDRGHVVRIYWPLTSISFAANEMDWMLCSRCSHIGT